MVEVGNGFSLAKEISEALYLYQKEGVLWFWKLYQKKQGGILGDDMGYELTILTVDCKLSLLVFLSYSTCSDCYVIDSFPKMSLCEAMFSHYRPSGLLGMKVDSSDDIDQHVTSQCAIKRTKVLILAGLIHIIINQLLFCTMCSISLNIISFYTISFDYIFCFLQAREDNSSHCFPVWDV